MSLCPISLCRISPKVRNNTCGFLGVSGLLCGSLKKGHTGLGRDSLIRRLGGNRATQRAVWQLATERLLTLDPIQTITIALAALLAITPLVLLVRSGDRRAVTLLSAVSVAALGVVLAVVLSGGAAKPASTYAGLLACVVGLSAVIGIRKLLLDQAATARTARREKAYMDRLFESAPEAVVLLDCDDRVLRANGEFLKMFRYEADEIVGHTINDLIAPPQLAEQALELTERVATGEPVSAETQRMRSDGSLIHVSILGAPVHDEAGQVAVYGIYRDITDRITSESALRASEARYALAAAAANDGLWDWDLKSDEVYYSPRWKEMLGYSVDEIEANPGEWFQRVHEEDLPSVERAIRQHLERYSTHFEHEFRMEHNDGTYRWVIARGIAVFGDSGPTRLAGSMADITDRRMAEDQLVHDAMHDALTNFPNRTLLLDRIERAVSLSKRQSHLIGVLVLDVDRFKVVNDSLGHTVGDEFLKAMGERLESCLRPGDTVARLGGDEFAILLDGMTEAGDAIRVVNRVFAELEQSFEVGGHEIFATTSIGVIVSASRYRRPEDLLRDADTAMHRVKERGGNGYELFDAEMHRQVVSQLQTEIDLRRALDRDEFDVRYQPIIELETGVLSGFEVLLRWRHPVRGEVGPNDFIALAEETGLIVPIGTWVLREACGEAAGWSPVEGRLPSISVNLSAKQFLQKDLLGQIETVLAETGLEPWRLHLEITESTLMDHAEEHVEILRKLKQLGVSVHVDDFGTGYSSLSYLHRFDVDVLKIDRSFVCEMTSKRENREIVRTVIQLAQNLGLSVTGEGIENPDQLEDLKSLKCTFGQGHLISLPLAAPELEGFLRRSSEGPQGQGQAPAHTSRVPASQLH